MTPLRDKALAAVEAECGPSVVTADDGYPLIVTVPAVRVIDALRAAGLLHDTHDPAGGWPRVQGTCPACGAHSLFLGKGGYVTCARFLTCDDPCRASDILLASPPPAVRTVTTTNTQTVVPPRDGEARIERAARAMFYDKFPDGSDALWEHLCAGFLRSARAAIAAYRSHEEADRA